MRTAYDVSKYIITKCSQELKPVSNLQLQKVLYFIQVAFLQKLGKPCFEDDFEAWMYGPVIPSIYSIYCGAGASDILFIYEGIDDLFVNDERALVDSIIEVKRSLGPWALVNETHEIGKAWSQVYHGGKGNRSIIPKRLIKHYG